MKRKQNPHLRRGLLAFVIMSGIYEFLAIFMYGFFMRLSQVYPMQQDLLYSVCLCLLLLVGFGLLQTYIAQTPLSALGFTLLITCITYQHYFLINAFWSKSNVQASDNIFLDSDKTYAKIILGEESYFTPVNYPPFMTLPSGIYSKIHLGATVEGAFKAALSMVVGWTSLLGRAGPMEAFVMTILGVIFYEINRQTMTRFAIDLGGSMTIFVFGGTMGFITSLVMRNARNTVAIGFERYKSSRLHAGMAALGVLFIWALLPTLVHQATVYDPTKNPPIYNAMKFPVVTNVMFALTGSVFSSFMTSLLYRGKISVRDIIQGTTAGGVAILTPASIIVNTAGAMTVGIVAGFVQVVYLAKLDKLVNKRAVIDSCGGLGMFVFAGIQGGFWSAIFMDFQVRWSNTKSVFLDSASGYALPLSTGGLQVAALFMTIAIAAAVGAVIGLIFKFSNKNSEEDQYNDAAYWTIQDDGICYKEPIGSIPPLMQSEINPAGGRDNWQSQPPSRNEY